MEIIDASKIPYGRAMAQEHINATLIDRARAGRFVARLKGGDPFVFGRGAEEVLACLQAGVPVTVVPGITSAVGVPTSAWLPVTHRGVAQEFHVVSVHVPPGDDRSTVDWARLGASSGTLVLMMAVERIGAVAAELLGHGRNPDTPVSVIADGTMPTQRTINSTLEQVEGAIRREGIRPPAIIVVGDVVGIAAEMTALMGACNRPLKRINSALLDDWAADPVDLFPRWSRGFAGFRGGRGNNGRSGRGGVSSVRGRQA